ncbi:hypothetical protein RRG08_021479 [Elysia crispata]|uniref:Uncharacterized protein n=1 Tax=Elysia crispata TaxID=231223 RepID=A0AAE1ED93_9GAST|nr:hypothetical protein RRG08_021479 [Elysia crispata]
MLLRIQPYNCTIQYKAGKEMIFADYLSRISPSTADEIELDKIVHQVSISEEKYKSLQEDTAKDPELNCLKSQIIQGWPENAKDVPNIIKKYWSMRDFLSIEDGLIVKNTAIIIPKKLLFNRKVQNQIPHIIRHTLKSEHIQNQHLARQNTQKTYFDQHRKELPPLIDNQQVSVQDTTTGLWSPATIIKSCGEARSYVIQTPDGTTLRRNRRHLKDSGRSQHAVPVTQPTDDDDHGDDDTLDNPAASTSDDPGKIHGRPPVLSTGPPKESVTWANALPTTRSNSSTAHTRSGHVIKPPKRFE